MTLDPQSSTLDPRPSTLEARLYKTGDLARYRPDGTIEFLGRLDHQVKIRGFRIELGEIESALRHHPAVDAAVALCREDDPGDKRLVAYVVPATDERPTTNDDPESIIRHPSSVIRPIRPILSQPLTNDASRMTNDASRITDYSSVVPDLRSYLKERLPDYMVPSAIVMLDALPLTLNGKVDRKALPRSDRSQPALEDSYVAPLTPTQELLAEIWAEVLGVPTVGIHHDFFELGGHSLIATQVIARIRGAFQVELPVRCFFETPTVAGLSEAIATAKSAGSGPRPSAITRISRERHRVGTQVERAPAGHDAVTKAGESPSSRRG